MAEAATAKKTTHKTEESISEAPKATSKKENKPTFAVLATGGSNIELKRVVLSILRNSMISNMQ
jgi:hypothetical protein